MIERNIVPSVLNNNIHKIIPIITQHLVRFDEKITKYFPVLNIEKYDSIHGFCFLQ